MFGVYKITNLINNKCYIGKSDSLSVEIRLEQHKNGIHSSKYLQNSIKKHGIENFKFEILEECDPDICWERERYWIAYYNSNNSKFEYNQTSGGERRRRKGYKLSNETKRKISESQIGRKRSKESVQKSADARRGIPRSDEDRLKISNGVKNQWSDPEKRAKLIKGLSENRKGKIMINNGEFAKLIYPSEKENYKGWRIGSLRKDRRKDKIYEIIE